MKEGLTALEVYQAMQKWQPSQAVLFTHFFVQMTELPEFAVNASSLQKLKVIMPIGAGFPQECSDRCFKQIPNLEVTLLWKFVM